MVDGLVDIIQQTKHNIHTKINYWILSDIVFVFFHIGRLSSASGGEEEPDTSHEWD